MYVLVDSHISECMSATKGWEDGALACKEAHLELAGEVDEFE